MRYHDYKLSEYTVKDLGRTIQLVLTYSQSSGATDTSIITFEDVELYNFVHTQESIITDIYSVEIKELVHEIVNDLVLWNYWNGVRNWRNGADEYAKQLLSRSCVGWRIESAIGFAGFVIAKSVKNA